MELFSLQSKLLLILLASLCKIIWTQSLEKTCIDYEATRYRDCYCGNKFLDYERICHNDFTYFEPILGQHVLRCKFACQNGGTLHMLPNGFYFCTNCNGTYGRCCEIETPFCGAVLLHPEGVITTNNFPNPYPSNTSCVWKIRTDPGKKIALGVKDRAFSVEQGSSTNECDRDWVSVYDGENKESRQIGPFCGNSSRLFQTIHSSGPHLYIEFKSNDDVQYNGFQLQYTTYRTGFRCGPRREFSKPTAIISSPQYPLSYRPQEHCEYEIIVNPGHLVELTTLHMNLKSSADCLEGDVIEVLRKTNSTDEYQTITKFCGAENYAPYTVRDASHILLNFTSAFISDGLFRIRYEQIPVPNFHTSNSTVSYY